MFGDMIYQRAGEWGESGKKGKKGRAWHLGTLT